MINLPFPLYFRAYKIRFKSPLTLQQNNLKKINQISTSAVHFSKTLHHENLAAAVKWAVAAKNYRFQWKPPTRQKVCKFINFVCPRIWQPSINKNCSFFLYKKNYEIFSSNGFDDLWETISAKGDAIYLAVFIGAPSLPSDSIKSFINFSRAFIMRTLKMQFKIPF